MKITALAALVGTSFPLFAAEPKLPPAPFNTDAEAQLVRIFERYREARSAVLSAIDGIKDEKRREAVRGAFAANEASWEALIDSETLLVQPTNEGVKTPNLKYRRLVEADRTPERIEQFRRIASVILNREKG